MMPQSFLIAMGLLAVIKERDEATYAHSKGTAQWARRLATAMRLSRDGIAYVELCALVHDVGKIALSDLVLFGSGSLSETETEKVRAHPVTSERILNQIPALQHCAVVVRAHHERFDGLGYPDGLFGYSIPFEARILAVSDAFQSMIAGTKNRAALPARQALEQLQHGRGSHWDPEVVDQLVALLVAGARRKAQLQLSTA
ncbi:MAG: HD domain-containing protein [Candidatus Eremiobacteraeota bacterium]|nr:HD domain-containing protein [Candidatus Eremiobacteraeota bacterium]